MGIIADIFEAILVDSDGRAIGTTSLTESNIEVAVQENDVRHGRGNALVGVLHADRDITLNFTEGEFKYDWIAQQLGQDIATGAGEAWAMPRWYEAEESDLETLEIDPETEEPAEESDMDVVITLEHEPLATDNNLAIYDADGIEIPATTGYTVSGKEVTLLTAEAGDAIEVRTYKYATPATTREIEIDNSVFGKGVQVVLETLEIDPETEEPIATLQYIFYKCLPSGNFSISTASERTAQTQAFSFRVVKPKTSTVVGKIMRIPIESV